MRSHTGGMISMGKGALYASSHRQKLTTKSSTEAELVVGASDFLGQTLWTTNFLRAQGYNNVSYVLARKPIKTREKNLARLALLSPRDPKSGFQALLHSHGASYLLQPGLLVTALIRSPISVISIWSPRAVNPTSQLAILIL
eukprot:scaffold2712_cov143-Cylindrotheca_fusiformis.AAC.4